jgi:molecular chaperone GrpE
VSAPEKGNFSVEFPEEMVRDALKSVERHDDSADPGAPDTSASVENSSAELESLRAQLEFSQAKGRELMAKLKETHERMLRAVADLENFKKRAQKEKEEVQKFGNERLLREFVPVMDNLERALEHAKSNSDFESLLTGVAMTRKQFEDALGRHGVKAFSAVGQPFDPHLHEAMQHVETTAVPPNHVHAELVRGYLLNERLVRPALVVVARSPEGAAAANSENDAGAAAPPSVGGGTVDGEDGLPVAASGGKRDT